MEDHSPATASNLLAVDTETTGVEWWDTAFLASTFDGSLGRVWELPDEADELRGYLADSRLILHNAKFDLQKLILCGVLERGLITPDRIDDTEAMAHLLDEHQVKGLKALAKAHLGEETDEHERIKEAKKAVAKELGLKVGEITYDLLPREIVIPYAIKDAEFTFRLYKHFIPQLEQHADLLQLYRDEMELSLVLMDMEAQTMKLDMDYLGSKAKEYGSKALSKELEIRDIVGREDFNPNSPKQVLEAFSELGVQLKTTDKVALRGVGHPLAEALLELRHLRKMHGTYLMGLMKIQRDGYVHLGFRQHGPKTGRMASGGSARD